MDFLFRSSDNTLAGTMMAIGSTALVFYSLSTLTNGILQGSGHFWLPIRNSALALAVHLPLLALSLWVFRGGILAVVINGCLFPLFVTVLNALELRRTLGYRQEWIRSAAIPLADSLLMALFVFLGYRLLRSAGLGNSFSLPIAVLAGIILYAFLLLITRAVSEKDLLSLPKGEKLAAFARRLNCYEKTARDSDRSRSCGSCGRRHGRLCGGMPGRSAGTERPSRQKTADHRERPLQSG
jgi:stage V sporulation protein B